MKRIKRFTAFLFALTLVSAGFFVGCGGKNVDGTYKLCAPDGEKEYSVTFRLNNPSYNDMTSGQTVITYLRLEGVYIKFRKIEGEGGMKLVRAFDEETKAQTYSAAVKKTGSWVKPFDWGTTQAGNLEVSNYAYYHLSATAGDMYLDEVAFIGEILDGEAGNGTGEYYVIPATIVKATPVGDESQTKALKRAEALLDGQPASAAEIIKKK